MDNKELCHKMILTEEIVKRKFFFFKKRYFINHILIDGEKLTYKNLRKFKFNVIKDKPFYFKYYQEQLYQYGGDYTHLKECYLTNISFKVDGDNKLFPVIKYKTVIYYFIGSHKNIKETYDKEINSFYPEILDYIEIYRRNNEENEDF